MKKIYVGNLPFSTDDDSLRDLFSRYGTVHSASVITDRVTGRSRGFGFVEMDDSDADEAINGVNGTEIDGRALRVNEAHDKRRQGR
jgi:RNA recognition motif-containing protein